LATRLSSGHHYMMADGREFFGVETSGKQKVVTQVGARAAHLHTNHCFDPVLRRCERVPRSARLSAHRAGDDAVRAAAAARPAGLWTLLASHEGYPRSLCSHVGDEWRPLGSRRPAARW
jgi:isopenicillin-N N-acyltransferase-like protein